MPESISIAMATYNGARFLREQLDSLIAQDLRPSEIVICDDASTDDTFAIACRYAASSPVSIRLVSNEQNLGWRANFMKAASLCSGELIAFCDQDDVWHPNKLSEVARRFERPEVLMVCHNAEVVDAELRHKGILSMQPRGADLMPPGTLAPWTMLLGLTMTFRRQLLQFWPLWNDSADEYTVGQRSAHDRWVCFLASSLGNTAYVEQPLLRYRQHGMNTMGIPPSRSLRDRIVFILGFAQVIEIYRMATARRIAALSAISALDSRYAEAAGKALAIYNAYSDILALAAVVYGGDHVAQRVRAAAELRQLDAYRGADWGLSRALLYKDMVTSILGPRILTTLHRLISR